MMLGGRYQRARTLPKRTLPCMGVLIVAACGSEASPLPDLPQTEGDASAVSAEASSSPSNPLPTQGDAWEASAAKKDAGVDAVVVAEAGAQEAAPFAPNPCLEAGTCAPGQWINVTPPGIVLAGTFGPGSVQVDSARPQDVYSQFGHHGIWKSTDYGLTWNGPINTGSKGDLITQTVGYIRIPSHS